MNSIVNEQYVYQLSFIDYFKNQLIEGFSKHNTIISVLQKFIPNPFNKFKPIVIMILKNVQTYQHVLLSYYTFESELKIWMEKWKKVPQNEYPKSAIGTFNKVSVNFFQIYGA